MSGAGAQPAATLWALFSALGGSIVGSLLGGTISYLLQQNAARAARTQREADRLETRKALAYSLLFKMIQIVSGLEQMRRLTKGQIDAAKARGVTAEPWQVMLPIGNPPDQVKFTPDEMALVLSLDDKLFNEIAALDQLHNSTSNLVRMYGERRTAMMARFGARMEGNTGTTSLSPEEYQWLAPRAVELNALIDNIIQRTEVDAQEAKDGLLKMNAAFSTHLGTKHTIQFK